MSQPAGWLSFTRNRIASIKRSPLPYIKPARVWYGGSSRATTCCASSTPANQIETKLFGILNAMRFRASNGLAEAINGQIRTLKVRSRGFRSKERFKRAILFHYGGLPMAPSLQGKVKSRVYTVVLGAQNVEVKRLHSDPMRSELSCCLIENLNPCRDVRNAELSRIGFFAISRNAV